MKRFAIGVLTAAIGCWTASAQDPVSFQGKTISMIVGFPAGGGTDAFGRLAANFLAGRLPGAPHVVVRNVPGAEGITSMNYLVQQVAPDGLTVVTAASTTADPLNYRKPQSHYAATDFEVFGGVGRGGSALLINKEAERRLFDRAAAPVTMGAPSGVPRSGMQITAWGIAFLGWNAKWIIGYRGTNELMLALERGEIDMTATANLFLIRKMIDTGRFRVLAQTGTLDNGNAVARPDLGDAPVLANMLKGRIADPLAEQAFGYWSSIASMDKWLALPPKAPKPVVEIYREAYDGMLRDADFVERGRKISDDFVPLSYREVVPLIAKLGSTPLTAIDYTTQLLRRQGLDVQ
jgi:tripartite-type tricarboxylate transporter receptor subunit TctC